MNDERDSVDVDVVERLDLKSADVAAACREELLRLFPEVAGDTGVVDFDRLRLVLGEAVEPGRERYGMTWPGKAECFRTIQTPSAATLCPTEDDSIAFSLSRNVLIEGDNLEVLKLLQKAYLGQVKLIYIDPPYNTGNDFIYPDNYTESLQTYLAYTGQIDSEGRKFSTNPETTGRFHTNWLNMMYPRLYLARNLLREDGCIFISIDDNEVANLRKICDEIFGEENRIEELVWAQNTTHSQSPLFSTNHEYILVYARSRGVIEAGGKAFREPKPGFNEVMNLVAELNPSYPPVEQVESAVVALMNEHRRDYESEAGRMGLTDADEVAKQDPWRGIYSYRHAEYRDSHGRLVPAAAAAASKASLVLWQEDNSSAPAAKQAASTKDPKSPNYRFYNPKHPLTGKPCPCPKTGWRWPLDWPGDDRQSFRALAARDLIVWGEDESKVPRFKRFLGEVESNVAKSFFFDYTDGEKEVASLLGEQALFPNPKPSTLVARFIRQTCRAGDLVMDFFAGSGTTAHAVLDVSRQDSCPLRFLLIQLPEPIDPSRGHDESVAVAYLKRLGKPPLITEITKERIRKVIERSRRSDRQGVQMQLDGGQQALADPGFKVFRLAESNFEVWDAAHAKDADGLQQQLRAHVEHIRPSRSEQDLLYELLLKSGFPLDAPTKKLVLAGAEAWSVHDGALMVCLQREVTLDQVRAVAEAGPERVVMLDAAFAGNDQLKANAAQIFKNKNIVFKTV